MRGRQHLSPIHGWSDATASFWHTIYKDDALRRTSQHKMATAYICVFRIATYHCLACSRHYLGWPIIWVEVLGLTAVLTANNHRSPRGKRENNLAVRFRRRSAGPHAKRRSSRDAQAKVRNACVVFVMNRCYGRFRCHRCALLNLEKTVGRIAMTNSD